MHKIREPDEIVHVRHTRMFLAAAHVLLRETLIVDKDGIHRGHFSSDERVNAMKHSRQISKLQLLEEEKQPERCFSLTFEN